MTSASNVSQTDACSAVIGTRGAAVITPYYKESLAVLERCHRSCQEQQGDWPLRHVMVADGHPRPELAGWNVDHIVLPQAHGDNGNTPRCLGAISAINQGYWRLCIYQTWQLPCRKNLLPDPRDTAMGATKPTSIDQQPGAWLTVQPMMEFLQ